MYKAGFDLNRYTKKKKLEEITKTPHFHIKGEAYLEREVYIIILTPETLT